MCKIMDILKVWANFSLPFLASVRQKFAQIKENIRINSVYSICSVLHPLDWHSEVDKLVAFLLLVEGTARYADLLLAPVEGFGLWQRASLLFKEEEKGFSFYCFANF